MSMIKAWFHDQMEKQLKDEELFFNAEMHHEMEQTMREEMDEPSIPSDIDPDYENFISNHPDGKYPPTNEPNDSNKVPF